MSRFGFRGFIFLAGLLAPIVFSSAGYTSVGSVFLQPRGESSSPAAFPTFGQRPYDVKAYDLTLDWRKPFAVKSQQFSGKNIITLRLLEQVSSITLDAALLVIDTITVNGVAIAPVPQPDANELLTIPLDPQFRQTTSDLTIAISYHRTDATYRGAFFYPKGLFVGMGPKNDSVFVAEDIMYTMSEPLDARAWMPCMDLPYDKANSDITIIAPNGITTASNGALIEQKPFDANSTLWHWRSDKPIATYLMVANASVFTVWGETHHRSSDPSDTVSLVYYAWPADYNQDSITDYTAYNARHSFRNTDWIMSNFESRYGPYPFEKYGQLCAQKFDYGGQEHQTITTINRSWIRYDEEEGMAHEMAHHWFGDKVTCRTFKDIWLNEGFATYSQAIWAEGWGGNTAYVGNVRGDAAQYFASGDSLIAIYDPPGADDMFERGTTVLFYPKAGAVIHMLRRLVNDDAKFFAALRGYTDTFAYASATTDDFQNVMSQQLGIDLGTFISEWIYGPGHPDYNIHWGQSSKNLLTVHIDQTQTMQDHFTMELRLFAYHGATIDTLFLLNEQRAEDYIFPLSYTVDSLGFDDDALVLSTYSVSFDPALEVKAEALTNNASLQAKFDPGTRSIVCSLSEVPTSEGRVQVYDLLGVKVLDEPINAGPQNFSLNAASLAEGLYFVRYNSGATSLVAKVQVVR